MILGPNVNDLTLAFNKLGQLGSLLFLGFEHFLEHGDLQSRGRRFLSGVHIQRLKRRSDILAIRYVHAQLRLSGRAGENFRIPGDLTGLFEE